VRRLVAGGEDPEWPCSFLHNHPDLDLIVDREAAAGIH